MPANLWSAISAYCLALPGEMKKAMELNLQALPNPMYPEDFSRSAIGQFKDNIKIAGQGLPRMPGVQKAEDIEKQQSSSPTSQVAKPHPFFAKFGGQADTR